MGIKRERWKNRFVWVARENGKLISWTNVKKSQIKTKQQATLIFKSKGTFSKSVISTTVFKGSGTRIIRSNKRLSSKKQSQLILKFDVFVNGKKIKRQAFGYSKRLSVDKDPVKTATRNAQRSIRQLGIADGIFKYEDTVTVKQVKKFKQYWNFRFRK